MSVALIGLLTYDFALADVLSASALLAALGGALVSGIAGAAGASATNSSNKKIARENRDWQTVENQKQRDFIQEMFDEQNEYNTPSAQMARYREAGLNPYLSQGQIGSGSSTSVPSAPSGVGSPNLPSLSNPMAAAAGILGDTSISLAQQKLAHTNEQMAKVELLGRVRKVLGEEAYQQMKDKILPGLVTSPSEMTQDWRKEESEIALSQSQGEIARQKASLDKMLNDNGLGWRILTEYDNNAMKIHSEIGKMASDAKVNDAQVKSLTENLKLIVPQAKKLLADAAKAGADAQTINALRKYVVDQAKYTADTLMYESGMSALDYGEKYADYSEDALLRNYKQSGTAQGRKKDAYIYANHVARTVVKDVTEVAGGAANVYSRGAIGRAALRKRATSGSREKSIVYDSKSRPVYTNETWADY